nr:EOG090X0G73 [Leptodora kindtii]
MSWRQMTKSRTTATATAEQIGRMISTESRTSLQRKRQRLDQLVDRIAHFVTTTTTSPTAPVQAASTCTAAAAAAAAAADPARTMRPASANSINNNSSDSPVQMSGRIVQHQRRQQAPPTPAKQHSEGEDEDEDDEEVFSPLATFCDRLTLSPCSTVDSPSGISFSSLSFEDDLTTPSTPLNFLFRAGAASLASPAPDSRRRARSDSDLHRDKLMLEAPVNSWLAATTPAVTLTTPAGKKTSRRLDHLRPPPLIVTLKRSSTDSDSSSPLFQDSPLQDSGQEPNSTAPPASSVRGLFTCEVCGQVFDLHDRLVKHLASRHKNSNRNVTPEAGTGGTGTVVKGYQCDVCQRPFARSDMLTRHMRLHTGLKPYTCRICGQVFSRSDHLSTHQRTHTGEKPYRCPQCAYAACRRDMITRHLRTHTRNEDLEVHDSRKDPG